MGEVLFSLSLAEKTLYKSFNSVAKTVFSQTNRGSFWNSLFSADWEKTRLSETLAGAPLSCHALGRVRCTKEIRWEFQERGMGFSSRECRDD